MATAQKEEKTHRFLSTCWRAMCGISQCLIFIFLTTNCLAYRCPKIPANIIYTDTPNKFLSPNPWRHSFPTFSWRTLHCLPDTGHVSAHWSPWARTACLVYHQYLAEIRRSPLEWMLQISSNDGRKPPALTGTQIQPIYRSIFPSPLSPSLRPLSSFGGLNAAKGEGNCCRSLENERDHFKPQDENAGRGPKSQSDPKLFRNRIGRLDSLFHRCFFHTKLHDSIESPNLWSVSSGSCWRDLIQIFANKFPIFPKFLYQIWLLSPTKNWHDFPHVCPYHPLATFQTDFAGCPCRSAPTKSRIRHSMDLPGDSPPTFGAISSGDSSGRFKSNMEV